MPRPRFQIHLSTGLAMMLVASTLLFLNLHDSYEPGWPLNFYNEYFYMQIVAPHGGPDSGIPFYSDIFFEQIQLKPLLLDILTALAILTFTAVLSEFLIRRRKPATPPIAEAIQ